MEENIHPFNAELFGERAAENAQASDLDKLAPREIQALWNTPVKRGVAQLNDADSRLAQLWLALAPTRVSVEELKTVHPVLKEALWNDCKTGNTSMSAELTVGLAVDFATAEDVAVFDDGEKKLLFELLNKLRDQQQFNWSERHRLLWLKLDHAVSSDVPLKDMRDKDRRF